jgi:hypothetical protein
MIHQEIRTDDYTVTDTLFKNSAQFITFPVGQMFFFNKQIAEGKTRRDIVLIHQITHFNRILISESDTSASPDAISGSTVYGTYLTPVIEKLPVLPEKRQEQSVQLVELKQPRQMIISDDSIRPPDKTMIRIITAY